MKLLIPTFRFTALTLATMASLLASGCAVAPVYQQPVTPQPAAYKETASEAEKAAAGWIVAVPA
ncbi:MAG: hypothetical protein J0626_12190, partial [Rhodospirillaceae bacterium]|nr:hypothetical protein [Rhodospirillaceae bacterium]